MVLKIFELIYLEVKLICKLTLILKALYLNGHPWILMVVPWKIFIGYKVLKYRIMPLEDVVEVKPIYGGIAT